MKNFYVFGGYKRVASKSSCFVFKCSESHWSYIESMNSKRHCAACEVFEGKIVVSGGIDSRTVLRSLEAYDHHSNRWGRLPDMIETRYRQSLVTSGNKLYAIGGVEEYSWEVFDNKTRKFTLITNSPKFTVFESNRYILEEEIKKIGACFAGDKIVLVDDFVKEIIEFIE